MCMVSETIRRLSVGQPGPATLRQVPRRLHPHVCVPLGRFRVGMAQNGGDHLLPCAHHRQAGAAGVTRPVARNAPYACLLREPGVAPVQDDSSVGERKRIPH